MSNHSIDQFVHAVLSASESFESILKQYHEEIHVLSREPERIASEERTALISYVQKEIDTRSQVGRVAGGREARALRLLVLLQKSIQAEFSLDGVVESQLSANMKAVRRTRKLKKELSSLVHHGESDVSELFWVYLSGTEQEKTIIRGTLTELPLEYPFVRLFRAMLSLVEMGHAPELFPVLAHKIFIESNDGKNSDNEIIAQFQGFTQGTAVRLRKRLAKYVSQAELQAILTDYPSDKRATPWPILESLSGLEVRYRARAYSSVQEGGNKLVMQVAAQEYSTKTLHTGNPAFQTADIFDAVYGLFSVPLENNLALVASRFLLGDAGRLGQQKELMENADRNPALLTALASIWMSPSQEQKTFLYGRMESLAKQGLGGVVQGVEWLKANGSPEQLQDFYKASLSNGAQYSPQICALLNTVAPEMVNNKTRRHVILSVFHKKRSLVEAIPFLKLESLSAAERVIVAELAVTHFSKPTRRALEEAFSSYWASNHLSADEVVWLARSESSDFRLALGQAVQAIVQTPPTTKWERFDQYLYQYALDISPVSESFTSVAFPERVKDNPTFTFFALMRFSMVREEKEVNEIKKTLLVNKREWELRLRNPKLFKETVQAYVQNDWRRSSWNILYDYNQIVPKKEEGQKWDWLHLQGEDSHLVQEINNKVSQKIEALIAEEFPKNTEDANEYHKWREEECKKRFQKSFYSWKEMHEKDEYESLYLPVIARSIETHPHLCTVVIRRYWDHVARVWEKPETWSTIEPILAAKIIGQKPKFGKDISSFPFEGLIALADRDKKEGKKEVDAALLWPWLEQRIDWLDYDSIGACLRLLIKQHEKSSDIRTTNAVIEEYMRRCFIHRISLARIKKFLNGVTSLIAEKHLDFFYRWLSFLLRGNTSTLLLGKILRSRPLEEVVNHRTCRRTMVMIESMYDQIIRFLEDDDRPRSDALFALIMEVALDVKNKKLADALVNLGYSHRVRTWIASYPNRLKAFFDKHPDWQTKPDWSDPHFPVYLTLWQNQPLDKRAVIDFLRLGEKPAIYAEGLMNCVVSQHPDYFSYMLTMLTNPTPTPTEIIQRMTVRNAIVGLGRIQASISKEDRMLIIEKLDAHYKLEVLPLVQLLKDDEWTDQMTISILNAIQSNGWNSNWEFLYSRKNQFSHWFAAFEHIWTNGYLGWGLRRIMAKRFAYFSQNHFKNLYKTNPATVWKFFSMVDKTAPMKNYLRGVIHPNDVDDIAKLRTCIDFGLMAQARVAWALLFQKAKKEGVEQAFELLEMLNNAALRSLIMTHHAHLLVDLYRNDSSVFIKKLSTCSGWSWNATKLEILKKLEELVGLQHQVDANLGSFLHLYQESDDYNKFEFIKKIQGFSSLEKIEQCIELISKGDAPKNNNLILRWYNNNRSVLLQSSFLRMVLHDQWGLRRSLEHEVLHLPIEVLRNQPVIWEYLSNAKDSPQLPDESNTNDYYRRNLASYWKQYKSSFFVRLLNAVVTHESLEYLVELTFWNASDQFLNGKRRIEFLRENMFLLVQLVKRDRNAFAKRYIEAFYPFQEKTFLPMVLWQLLSEGHTTKLLSTLRSHHYAHQHYLNQKEAYEEEVRINTEKGEETTTPIPVAPHCWLIGQLDNYIETPHLLVNIVREMIKEPDSYRYLFGEKFFTAAFDQIVKAHPRSIGAMLRRFENIIEVSPELPVFGLKILEHLPLSQIKKQISTVTALYFYRGENPWRSLLNERMVKEPEIQQEIVAYALNTLSQRHQENFSTLEINFEDLYNLKYTRSNDMSFVELPTEKKRSNIISTWTSEDNKEHSSYASGGASLVVRRFEQKEDWASFWPWAPNQSVLKSTGLHVFDSGALIVNDAVIEAKTEGYNDSSTSFHVQTQLRDHKVVRFVYGPLQTNNVFENLGDAVCRLEYAKRIKKSEYKGEKYWDHWKLPVFSIWAKYINQFSTFLPMSHPHDQSIQVTYNRQRRGESAPITLKGGYQYPNMDLSPEFAVLDTICDVEMIDALSTKVLISLLFCPSEKIKQAAQAALRHRDFKRDDLRHVFVVPHHDWLWEHVQSMDEKKLHGLWKTVLNGLCWEDEKRTKQVLWFFHKLYRPKEDAQSLVNELEASVLTPRGFANAQGFLQHADLIFDAVEQITSPSLKIRALTCLLSGPLYKTAQEKLNVLKEDPLMQLHILCNKTIPGTGVPLAGVKDSLIKSLDASLQDTIQDSLASLSMKKVQEIDTWKELGLHEKVGVYTLLLSQRLASQPLSTLIDKETYTEFVSSPYLAQYHGIHKSDPVAQLADSFIASITPENESLCLQQIQRLHTHLPDGEKWRLMISWLTMWVHPTSSRGRSLANRILESLTKTNAGVRGFILERISSLLSKRSRYKGMVDDVYLFLTEALRAYHYTMDPHYVWRMFNGPHRKAQAFALNWFQSPKRLSSTPITLDMLQKMGLHSHEQIRGWAMKLVQERNVPTESFIVFLPWLERGTPDVQAFVQSMYQNNELSFSLLLRLADSTEDSVHALGVKLLEEQCGVNLSADVVVQLSEHPDTEAEDYVAGKLQAVHEAERIAKLVPYFKRVFSRVNSGRATRDTILTYIRERALSSSENANVLLGVMEWMCDTQVVHDRMFAMETLVLAQSHHSSISSSIQL